MILSRIRIYAYLTKFYCQDVHTFNTFWWDSYRFQFDTCDRLYRNRLEIKLPWPNICTRMYSIRAILLICLSVFLTVLGLASDNVKRTFKDFQLIPPIEQQYFLTAEKMTYHQLCQFPILRKIINSVWILKKKTLSNNM